MSDKEEASEECPLSMVEQEAFRAVGVIIRELNFVKYNLYLNAKAQIFNALCISQDTNFTNVDKLVDLTESVLKKLDKPTPDDVQSNEDTTPSE